MSSAAGHPPRPSPSETRGTKRQAEADSDTAPAKKFPVKIEENPLSHSPTPPTRPRKMDTEWEAVVALTELKTKDEDSSDSSGSEGHHSVPKAVSDQIADSQHPNSANQPPALLSSPLKENGTPQPNPTLSQSQPKKGPQAARLLQLPPLLRLPVPATWQQVPPSPGCPPTPQMPSSSASVEPPKQPIPVNALSPASSSGECYAAADASTAAPGHAACNTCLSLSLLCQCHSPAPSGKGVPGTKGAAKPKPPFSELSLWPSSADATPGPFPVPCHLAVSLSGSGASGELGHPSGPRTPNSILDAQGRNCSFKDWAVPAPRPKVAPPAEVSRGQSPSMQQLALFPEIQALGLHWEALISRMQQHVAMATGVPSPAGAPRDPLVPVAQSEEYRRLSGYLDSLVSQLKQQQMKQQQLQHQGHFKQQPSNNRHHHPSAHNAWARQGEAALDLHL